MRLLIDRFVSSFERTTLPLLHGLRQSAIHNDANDYNVLVSSVQRTDFNRAFSQSNENTCSTEVGTVGPGLNHRVVGLVDFGDMVHSFTVGDLAVAIAYAILDKADPLAAAAHVAAGYHAEFPLSECEVAALFGLVSLRLDLSGCRASN